MGFKGSLDSINLADIFQNLATNQQTGVLQVSDRERTKSIFFQRGEVRYLAHEGRKNMLLGEMLTGRGIATHEQVAAALAEQKNSGRLLGEIIVSLEICTREEVDDLVRFQIEEEIYDLFSWERAEFEFTDGPAPEGLFDPEQQATELAIDTSRLIMEAARRIDEWERIRQIIPSTEEVFVAATSAETLPEGISPVAARILTYLDGTRSIKAVVEDSYFSRFEVATCIVAMIEAGQVWPASVEVLEGSATLCMQQGKHGRAVELMERALAMGADDASLRYQLAEACISLGDNKKAAIHLNVFGDGRQDGGDLEGAVSAYERITEILPGSVAAHEKLARLMTKQGKNEQALEHYVSLVQALMEAGRLDEAAARCQEGLKLDPENTDLRNALAKVLLSSGDKDGATDEFGRLAEIFARAGQPRPAAEVFRRILQIDPRNRHAKRRLNEVVAGTGVKREPSHALRNVLIGLVLVLLGAGVYFVLREMAAQAKFDKAEKRSRDLEKEERFEEAREVWRGLEEEWSLSLDFKKLAAEKIVDIDKSKDMLKKRREAARRRKVLAARRTYEEALAHEEAYEIDAFRAKIKEFLALEAASFEELEEMKGEARKLLNRVNIRERKVAEYLRARERTASRTDIASLEDERRRTLSIHSEYRRHPKLKNLTVPFRIETEPTGASVFIDGKPRGTAPLVHRYRLGKAPAVRVEMPGYVTEEDIDVRDRIRVQLKLRRAVAWHFRTGAAVLSLTKGPEGTVLVANQEGLLAALDPTLTGASAETRGVAWTFRTRERSAGIGSGVNIVGSVAYFGTDRPYAFDLDSKELIWAGNLGELSGGRIPAAPTVGTVKLVRSEFVFGTYDDPRGDGAVWAVDRATAQFRWSKRPSETRARTRCRPLVAGDRLFVPFTDGRVYALKVVDGETIDKWSAGAPSSFISSIVLDGGLAWLVSGDGGLYGLDLDSRERRPRTFDAGKAITTDLTVADGVGYFGDQSGGLHAVELETLSRVWPPFPGEGKATAAPVVGVTGGAGRVYFGTSTGWVYAVDRGGGTLVWKRHIGEEVSSVYFTGRYLLAASRDGTVYAFDEEALK